jgi:hypothetical protein
MATTVASVGMAIVCSAFVVDPYHAVRTDLLDLGYIGVGHHVRLGFKIPWVVLRGSLGLAASARQRNGGQRE